MTWPKGYNPPQSKDKTSYNNGYEQVVCKNCNKSNPSNSRFCNQCGAKFPLICYNCGNTSNLYDASFCNECGSKLSAETKVNLQTESLALKLVNQNENNNYQYQQYTLPEHNIRIRYPDEWEKIDKEKLIQLLQSPTPKEGESQMIVVFRSPQENPSDSFLEMFGISRQDHAIKISLENYVKLNLNDLQISHEDFSLLENVKTILAGEEAIRLVYDSDGIGSLFIFTQLGSTFYFITFISEITKYQEYISIIETMINSFEFISKNGKIISRSETIEQNRFNHSFRNFQLPEHRLSINYPSSWIKARNPSQNIEVMFQPLKENSTDIPSSFYISIINNQNNFLSIKDLVDSNIQDLRNSYPDFNLYECYPTTINEYPSYQLVYSYEATKYLIISTLRYNKAYIFCYFTEPSNYMKHLAVAEQMVSSIEFL